MTKNDVLFEHPDTEMNLYDNFYFREPSIIENFLNTTLEIVIKHAICKKYYNFFNKLNLKKITEILQTKQSGNYRNYLKTLFK